MRKLRKTNHLTSPVDTLELKSAVSSFLFWNLCKERTPSVDSILTATPEFSEISWMPLIAACHEIWLNANLQHPCQPTLSSCVCLKSLSHGARRNPAQSGCRESRAGWSAGLDPSSVVTWDSEWLQGPSNASLRICKPLQSQELTRWSHQDVTCNCKVTFD